MYGMRQHSPYIEPDFVKWAIDNTEREDCIGIRPIRLFYGEETQDHITGKVILREAYETVSSWRRKDPIEMGSGATVIGHDFKSTLKATTMVSPDIRAGVSLLIAALSAKGTSTIHNIEQIDRGYEDIDTRLRAIGAKIDRV